MPRKKRRPRARQLPLPPAESRATEILTVGWMLAVVTTLVLLCAAGVAWLIAHAGAENSAAALLLGYLRFSALVTASVSLALLAAVMRLRKRPPPLAIVLVAVVVALVPLVTAFL